MLDRLGATSRSVIYNSNCLEYNDELSFDFEETLAKIDDILFKESKEDLEDDNIIYTIGYRFPRIYSDFRAMYDGFDLNRKQLDPTNKDILNKEKPINIYNEHGDLIISKLSIVEGIHQFKPFYSVHAAKLMVHLFDFYYLDVNSNYTKVLLGDTLGISEDVHLISNDVNKIGCPVEYIEKVFRIENVFARSIWDYFTKIFDKRLLPILLDNVGDYYSISIHTDKIRLVNHGSIKSIRYSINEYLTMTDRNNEDMFIKSEGAPTEEEVMKNVL